MSKCGPKGRDCIEKNFTHTFNCNMTCEGIYADVQRLEKNEPDQPIEVKLSGNSKPEELYKELYAKLMKDFERKMEVTKGDKTKSGEEVDKLKFQKLIAEYKNFKRNNVQHFRFNSESNQTAFGQF